MKRHTSVLKNQVFLMICITNSILFLLLKPYNPSWLHYYSAFEFHKRKRYLQEIFLSTHPTTLKQMCKIKLVTHHFIEVFIVILVEKKTTTLQAALGQLYMELKEILMHRL